MQAMDLALIVGTHTSAVDPGALSSNTGSDEFSIWSLVNCHVKSDHARIHNNTCTRAGGPQCMTWPWLNTPYNGMYISPC